MRREVDDEFAAYVRARQHRLLRAAYLVCGDAHLAEDLLQQALTKVALRWEQLRSQDPDAYARRILYRDAISAWRRTRRESLSESLSGALSGGTAETVAQAGPWGGTNDVGGNLASGVADRVDLQRALATLTPKQRAVLVLRFFEDRTEADTADVLGVTVGTVKSQTHAALVRLRERIPDLAPSLTRGEHP
ncbi:MAG: SigE family RNA polymerase sigma factor [Microbacteriaceae bacterium]